MPHHDDRVLGMETERERSKAPAQADSGSPGQRPGRRRHGVDALPRSGRFERYADADLSREGREIGSRIFVFVGLLVLTMAQPYWPIYLIIQPARQK